MLTPLEQGRREYRQLGLSAKARARIWLNMQQPRRFSASWSKSVGVGFVAGSLALGGFFLVQRNPAVPHRETAVAVLHDVRGVVQSRSQNGVASSPLVSDQTVLEGTWLETQPAASLRFAMGPHRAAVAEDTRIRLEHLDPKHLAFALAKGTVEFEVDPLPPAGTLTVQAGELVVQVVGTVFSVGRAEGCSSLRVTKGRVRSAFRGRRELLGPGESRRFCERTEADVESAQGAASSPESSKIASGLQAHAGSSPNAHALATNAVGHQELPLEHVPSTATRPLTEEEEGFRRGIQALQSGDVTLARESLETYLQRYPGGSFSQDALFQLVRLHYATGSLSRAVEYGKRYLAASAERDVRSNEVRLLLAQSLLHQGNAANDAYTLLAPLVNGASSTGAHAEQTLYLYILAASRSGRHEEARHWAERYAADHPNGSYTAEIRKLLMP